MPDMPFPVNSVPLSIPVTRREWKGDPPRPPTA